MAANRLKIIQHNVRAWTYLRKNELCNTYSSEDPDVILINSHGLRDDERMKIFNYTIYQQNFRNELHDGVAIAIKKNIPHKIIDDLEENYLAITLNTSLGPVCLATGYQPPRRPAIPIQNIIRLMRQNTPTYFMGDLNALHRNFDHRRTNAAGRQLIPLAANGLITHLGPDFATFISERGHGTPDIILTNNRHIHNIHTRPGPITTSDHLPIVTLLSASPIQVPSLPRFLLHRADWDGFRRELTHNLPINLDGMPNTEIDRHLNSWFDQITAAMDRHIPKSSHITLPHPRTTDELRDIHQEFQTLQRLTNGTAWSRDHRRRLAELQQHLFEACKRERNAHWNTLLQNMEADYRNPTHFWRQVKKLLGNTQQHTPYVINEQGQKLFTDHEMEQEFRRFWSEIYKISDEDNRNFCHETQTLVEQTLQEEEHRHTPYDNIDLNRLVPGNTLLAPIPFHLVKSTISSFKNRKAPGHSKIDKNILQQIPDNMLVNLTHILNASLAAGIFPRRFKHAIIKFIPKKQKPTSQVQNHRPISLLETVAKLYEKIINTRFRSYLESNNLNNPRQHSYRQKRGTHTAIALLYEEISASQRNREQCNVVLRDVSKAFDKVYHPGLKYKILRLNLPRCFTALLCNFLDDRTARIQLNKVTGEEFQLKSGVPQGSCLSPTLYNLYVADLGELNHGTYIQYADDITQIIRYPGQSRELCKRRTEAAIQEVNEFERKWKIKTNAAKFQVLHPSKRKPSNITQQGRAIRFSRVVKILGLKVNCSGIQPHVSERRSLASQALSKLKRFSALSPRTKLHLYKAMAAPHLTYPPVPLNIISNSNLQKLQAVQNKALRWINGDRPPYTTRIQELHQIHNLTPLNVKIFEAALRTWDTIRDILPEEELQIQDDAQRGSHAWWNSSYIEEWTAPPDPVYCSTGRR